MVSTNEGRNTVKNSVSRLNLSSENYLEVPLWIHIEIQQSAQESSFFCTTSQYDALKYYSWPLKKQCIG